MNKYVKLIITIVVIVAVFAGVVVLYNNLVKDYDKGSNLVGNNSTTLQENEGSAYDSGEGGNSHTEADNTETTSDKEDAGDEEAADSTKAIDFSVYDIDNKEFTLYGQMGKPVVVNFWASWCGPCKSELPDFEKAYQELGDEVTFMMVNLTGSGETVEGASEFIKEQGYTFPVYYDVNQSAAYAYYVTSIPTTFFIDAEGNVAAYAQGMIDYETILQGIDMAR